jgi:hypothetical protein
MLRTLRNGERRSARSNQKVNVSNFEQIIAQWSCSSSFKAKSYCQSVPVLIVVPLAHERYEMFTAKQYRAKAAEYREYLNASRSPAETSEFRNLEQTYTILADNEEWLALNAGKIVPASDYDIVPTREDEQDKRVIPVKDDERILRCLSAWAL